MDVCILNDFIEFAGKRIHEEKKADGNNFCGDLVKWTAEMIIELVKSDPDIQVT